jgi:hypothetical protein
MTKASHKKPTSILGRLSVAGMLLVALLMIVLFILIAAYPSVTFVRNMFVGTLLPLEQFDSGETLTFEDTGSYTGYLISMEVDERNADLPTMQVEILNSQGNAPVSSPLNRWNSVMGREYKQFIEIDPPDDGKLTITIETEESEDFLIHRRIDDVFEREVLRSTPLWIVSLIPLMIAVVLIAIAMIRMINESSKVDLRVE